MKIKVTTTGTFWAYVPDLGREAECEYVRKEYVDIPDEELLDLSGYAPSNRVFDAARHARNRAECFLRVDYEICEDGLAKDVPFLEEPFKSVEEMREYLSREEVIKMFEDE